MPDLSVTILLLDGFSNMVLACFLEPLRAVRDQGCRDIVWGTATIDGRPAVSSSGLKITPDASVAEHGRAELFAVIAGYGYRDHANRETARAIVHAARRSELLVGADTGPWLLAHAGLLRDRSATAHWQVLAEFAETFPQTRVLRERYVRDDRIWTCGGASTALDLMIAFIGDRFGSAYAFDASTMFLHDAAQQHESGRGPGHLSSKAPRALREALNRMVETIESPIALTAVARSTGVSPRSLHRMFLAELGMPPGRYYQLLRLARARDLASQTQLGQREIALRCGFADAPALSKAFVRNFGHRPSEARRA